MSRNDRQARPTHRAPRPQPGADHAVTIGIFGPRVAVRELMQVGESLAGDGVRFLSGAFSDREGAIDQFDRLADRLDVAVFPGPWQRDQYREWGPPDVPMTAVPLTGESLYVALLRAQRAGVDIARVSIDSLGERDVAEAYEEIGVSADEVAVKPYAPGLSQDDYLRFHRSQLSEGSCELALTTFSELQRQLEVAGLPVRRMRPTRSTVRQSLATALLLARGSRMHENQIAMLAVQLPPIGDGTPEGPSNYWHQELALSVHRFLLEEIRHSGAILRTRSDSQFMITTTRGGLDEITSGLLVAPFLARCRSQLGLDLRVGVGLGTTAQQAERHALSGLDVAARAPDHATLVELTGTHRLLPAAEPHGPQPPRHSGRAADHLRTLVAARRNSNTDTYRPDDAAELTVDVEDAASILGVTSRSARRICKTLVEAGLAWPTTPVRSPNGGRPRQQFRLLADKVPPA